MHSSRMRTTRMLWYRGPCQGDPLDRDPPDRDHPLDRDHPPGQRHPLVYRQTPSQTSFGGGNDTYIINSFTNVKQPKRPS